jgi:sulfatase modifying factor 1
MKQSNLAPRRYTGASVALWLVALSSSCTTTVGPYVRNIEVKPDGVVIVERCSSVVTDYGLGSSIDNDPAYCDSNVLPIGQPAPTQVSGPSPVAAGPVFPAPPPPAYSTPALPPPPPATPAQVATPSSVAPGVGVPTPVGPCPPGMAQMPHGSFSMGDRKDRVKVDKFCIDITEVTADAYAACVRNGQCSADGLSCGPAATYGVAGKGGHPINCVDWSQAGAYCQAQGKRLPTEEEWEWTARGGVLGKTFPWGNVQPSSQVCWSGFGQLTGTCPVGSYPPGANPQGILDLSGNVWEWTSGKKDAGSTERVARGGAWSSTDSSYLRASERYWTSPLYRFIYIGFRCAK